MQPANNVIIAALIVFQIILRRVALSVHQTHLEFKFQVNAFVKMGTLITEIRYARNVIILARIVLEIQLHNAQFASQQIIDI